MYLACLSYPFVILNSLEVRVPDRRGLIKLASGKKECSSSLSSPSPTTSRVAAASQAAAVAASHAFAKLSSAFSSAKHRSSPSAAADSTDPGGIVSVSTPSSPASNSPAASTAPPAVPAPAASPSTSSVHCYGGQGAGGHHTSSSSARKSRRRSSSTSTGRKRSTTIPAITAADASNLTVSSPSATSGTSAASASAPASPSLLSSRVRMLSPKMQRSIRINENQVIMLWEKARNDHTYNNSGYLHKRSSDSNRWQQRWFLLYQNLLFYAENEKSVKPSGVILLEGCYCERLITSGIPSSNRGKDEEKQYCFAITYRRDNQRQYDLRADSEIECKVWIEAIRPASFNKVLLQKEELEQQHLHLLQIVESEKTAKSLYTQQVEELSSEIRKLRAELCSLKKTWSAGAGGRLDDLPEDSEEIRKIKKVQSFFRGWLCRRRWKQIVEEYIRSPHADSMRKRNSLVFRMVEAEEEYVDQLNLLVSCFLRPFKMAASSKKPPCNHEDVNSIFLNSETLLFLHQEARRYCLSSSAYPGNLTFLDRNSIELPTSA
ncbi:Dbl (DH) domain [Trinorchestia longiramus]|nr:Dbl (DH) domain [Trinorchestia longiramus]